MNKAQSLSGIIKVWMDLPETDRTTLYFPTFYHSLEVNHPDLLKWRQPSGQRDREVKAQLLNKGLMSIPV